MRKIISTSDGRYKTLVFESKELFHKYEEEDLELNRKYYDLICQTSGIWAGNQGKFVKDRSQLNEWDIG